MAEHFDVLVIGAGPGGYPAAIRASQLGFKTACIEKELLGGVCLNWGCIPSKALLKAAETWQGTQHLAEWGITAENLSIDFDKVIQRSRGVSQRFNKGVAYLFDKYGVTSIKGTAAITGPGAVQVVNADGDAQDLTATHILLATGARARTFPSIQPDGEAIHTYRTAIVSTHKPASCIILGAGAIGIEFAYFYNAMGVDVTVIEGQEEILPVEDREVGKALRKALKKQGIAFKLNTMVDRVERDGDHTRVVLQDGTALDAERTLIALGITPNSQDLGLDTVGIELERGFIRVDTSFRTTAKGFYALGDVCSQGPALAHTATAQAHACIERIAGHAVPDVNYTANPSCTYCQPQVASVGLTERAARAQGLRFKVGRFPFSANGKAQGGGHPEGFVKVLVDETYGEILGAHILGYGATEMIAEFTLARSAELTSDELLHTIHAHPTLSEAMLEAVGNALGSSVHI